MKTGARWRLAIATVVGIGATVALGWWQWDRAQQKLALQAAIEERKALPAIDAAGLVALKNVADALHRPVVLQGRWEARHTVFLDNRQMYGRPGFYVVTPLRVAGTNAVVLVQRGWVPRNFIDRTQLPPVPTPEGEVQVRGRIAPPPARLYELGEAGNGPIRQNLDLPAFARETGLSLLLQATVQQTGAASEGLMRDWPVPASGAQKNYGYAFQWWAISGVIAILYVWFQFIAPRRRARPV